jgi:hypothetical protein
MDQERLVSEYMYISFVQSVTGSAGTYIVVCDAVISFRADRKPLMGSEAHQDDRGCKRAGQRSV